MPTACSWEPPLLVTSLSQISRRSSGITSSAISWLRGNYIHTTGDGLLATFDGPARAVRCAQAIGPALRDVGLEIRAGCQTGEIERTKQDMASGQRVL